MIQSVHQVFCFNGLNAAGLAAKWHPRREATKNLRPFRSPRDLRAKRVSSIKRGCRREFFVSNASHALEFGGPQEAQGALVIPSITLLNDLFQNLPGKIDVTSRSRR